MPEMEWTPFHRVYYRLLEAFAAGRVRRMMVSVPPQHGKSRGASVLLPAYLLGRDPELRIAVASYSFALAGRLGQEVQRLMSDERYRKIFPAAVLKGSGPRSAGERTARRTAQEFDCVGAAGGLKAVGRTGSLTGCRVDVLIADDLYKDALEAHSPLVRERVWEWYQAVARTRLHDGSRELVVCTRWHEDDLIGRLKRTERVVELRAWDQLVGLPPDVWVSVSFEALKASPPTELDPRAVGEPLWPGRHSAAWLAQRRAADPAMFEALFQGNPVAREGLLYEGFSTYVALPAALRHRANYTDTADTGDDRLCSICYAAGVDGLFYVTDVVYSPEPMEETEVAVAAMLVRNGATVAHVESNNGGRGFGRAVERRLREGGNRLCVVRLFHQGGNKEARILTHAPTVERLVRFPADWRVRWPEFAADVCGFRRVFRANAHDDGPDALTGIVETELEPRGGRIRLGGFSRR
ncbi:phage terminase large subunit [uncultured Rikenella sp.]|uniref:phage terminase large subunit n=1 Tax=uncultured Rikenella sp. TaxID=368003 RepID=UPI0026394A84|nr:phage terminase large subunit [uncultured Rikenella sp.]